MFRKLKPISRYTQLICVASICFILTQSAYAQEQCETIVQQAIETADQNCDGIRRNEACYGNVMIDAEANPDVDEFIFAEAGDIVNVSDLASLRLSSRVDETGEWGIATIYTQANLPDTTTDYLQIVVYGDVSLQNNGLQGDVALIDPPTLQTTTATEATPTMIPTATPEPFTISVTANSTINVRSGPSTGNSIVGSLSGGTAVEANGRNSAGDWVSITLDDGIVGWAYAPLLTASDDVIQLDEVVGIVSQVTSSSSTTDGINNPSSLVLGDTINAVMSAGESSLFFDLTAVKDERISIYVESPIYHTLYLYDPNGELIQLYAPQSIDDFVVPETGQYQLEVRNLQAGIQVEEDSPIAVAYASKPPLTFGATNAFTVTSTETNTSCAEAPSSGLLIQTPKGVGKITFILNEVIIEMASTVYVELNESGMDIGVVEGNISVTISDETETMGIGGELVINVDSAGTATFGDAQPYDREQVEKLPFDILERSIEIPEAYLYRPGIWRHTYPAQDGNAVDGGCPTGTRIRETKIYYTTGRSMEIRFSNYESPRDGVYVTEPVNEDGSLYQFEVIGPNYIEEKGRRGVDGCIFLSGFFEFIE